MLKIFICGDIVNTKSDTCFINERLADIIKSSDYAIGNFEAPVSGVGYAQEKSGSNLNQKASTLKQLKESGFDLLLLANNHILDFGEDALNETIRIAEANGLDTTGAGGNFQEAYKPYRLEINGIKIGIINACEAQFGVLDYNSKIDQSGYAWINHSEIDKNIIELKKLCDHVIVCAHAGLENYNIPLNEWRMRYQHLCEIGADAVVASHPHVPQGIERYKNSVICYSLGDFYFDWGGCKKNESYSIQLAFENDKIEYDVIFHEVKDGLVDISNIDHKNAIKKLNSILDNEVLEIKKEDILKINRYLVKSLSYIPTDGTFIGSLKEVVATLLGKRNRRTKSIDAYHFVRNETYNYVISKYLSVR